MKRQDSDHGLFERLTETLTDPYVDRVFLSARAYEEEISHLDPASDEAAGLAHELMHDLDAGWIYRGKTLRVTGAMTYVDDDGQVGHERIVEAEAVSNG